MSGVISAAGGALSAGALLTPVWPPKAAAYTPNAGELVLCDTTGGAWTLTFPAGANDGTMFGAKLVAQASGNAVTLACATGDTFNLVTGATTGSLGSLNQCVIFTYKAAVSVWVGMDMPAISQIVSQVATAFTAPKVVALTDAATIAVNAALGNDFRVTLGGSRTMGAPSNPSDGQQIVFQLTQDGTGSRIVTWNAAYDFGAVSAPTLSTAAAKVDLVRFVYNATLTKWAYQGSNLGM